MTEWMRTRCWKSHRLKSTQTFLNIAILYEPRNAVMFGVTASHVSYICPPPSPSTPPSPHPPTTPTSTHHPHPYTHTHANWIALITIGSLCLVMFIGAGQSLALCWLFGNVVVSCSWFVKFFVFLFICLLVLFCVFVWIKSQTPSAN